MASKLKAVVVGSGLSGLCTALGLATMGIKADVFEKKSITGGSYTSYKWGGYQVDTGLHLLTRGRSGELPMFLRNYIQKDIFEKYFSTQNNYRFVYDEVTAPLPGNLKELFGFRIMTWKGRLNFLKMILNLKE